MENKKADQINKSTTNLSLTRCITPKRVTSLRGPSPRYYTYMGNTASFEEMSPLWRAIDNHQGCRFRERFFAVSILV